MRRTAFSLIELAVVMGAIGILISLALPGVQRIREASSRAACLNKMKQIGLALHSYHATHGRLPPLPAKVYPSPDPNAALAWTALILPEIDQAALYMVSEQACRVEPIPVHNPPHVGMATPLPAYVCPNDGRLLTPLTDQFGTTAAFSSYIGVGGYLPPKGNQVLPGMLEERPGIRLERVADGTSQTLMVGERPPPDSLQAGWWYPVYLGFGIGYRGPNNQMPAGELLIFADDGCAFTGRSFGPGRLDNPCDRYHFWSLHPGGGNWLFADGSARYLAYSAEPIIGALATREGGEAVTVPD